MIPLRIEQTRHLVGSTARGRASKLSARGASPASARRLSMNAHASPAWGMLAPRQGHLAAPPVLTLVTWLALWTPCTKMRPQCHGQLLHLAAAAPSTCPSTTPHTPCRGCRLEAGKRSPCGAVRTCAVRRACSMSAGLGQRRMHLSTSSDCASVIKFLNVTVVLLTLAVCCPSPLSRTRARPLVISWFCLNYILK